MSDSPSKFSTVGAAAPDAVNDHPTLRFAHLTPERVVNADREQRLELHALCLDAGAPRLAAELERWTPAEQLERCGGVQLVTLGERAVTSELAARCSAELERRAAQRDAAQRILARYSGARFALELPRAVPTDTGREHAPIAERVRHARRGRRGWLVASSDSGRLSLVLWRVPELRESTRSDAWRQTLPRRRGRTEWLSTLETRLGW